MQRVLTVWLLAACCAFPALLPAQENWVPIVPGNDNEWKGDGWQVTKTTLHGGKQEGVEVVTIDNGPLEIVLLPTRGMSILEVRHKQLRLGWDSPVKEVVHPRNINLESRGGLGWLEGFNEWLVRCGLEYAGQPGPDEFITNTGARAKMQLTLHGKIGNTPASEVKLAIDNDTRRLRIRGVVYERMFFGPKLRLTSELSVAVGKTAFKIIDEVTNEGGSDQEFQLIYHTNFGAPLLEKGAQVVTASELVAPFNAHAAKDVDHYEAYAEPTPNFVEQVYLMRPVANSDGRTMALLHNADGDRGATIRWNTRELPYLTQWKNTSPLVDGYVTGLEPATGYPLHRSIERQSGRLPVLKPGESRNFTLEFGLAVGRDAVDAAKAEIAKIQGDHPPLVLHSPPTLPLTPELDPKEAARILKWQGAIDAFTKQDRDNPPPQNAVLFVGSSSIRKWDLPKYFDQPVINRGFGGSQMADSLYYVYELVLKHHPGTVVVYAGDNDLASGKSPEQVVADFKAFIQRVHAELPKARILYIAVKPSISRWKLIDKIRICNRLIAKYTESDPQLVFIDIDKPMLGEDGKPRPEFFVKDGLHMTDAGYRVWTSLIKPYLK